MVIQLLYFPDCPNVAAARSALDRALKSYPDAPPVAEIDVTDPRTPAHLRAWGSPTILVDGFDVAGDDAPEGEDIAPCCRVYGEGESRGAPLLVQIMFALERARQSPNA
jgi:hypothetical protein